MTRPFSSPPPLAPRAGQRRSQRQLPSLLGCSLGCLVAGCAERYDIGAFQDQPQTLQTADVTPSSAGVGVMLADGVEDADVRLDGVNGMAGSTPGDFDGDGFDDLLVTSGENPRRVNILYGGPRPSDGVVRLAQQSSALGLDHDRHSLTMYVPRDGDFDGDGANDLPVGVGDSGFYYYDLSGEAAAEQDAALAGLVQRWTEMRAFLWYGNPERPAQVDFAIDAVAFRAGDDLSSQLARVLEEHAPEEIEANIFVGVNLNWLGDVDGDGLGDLALSTAFTVSWGHTARQRTEEVTYMYYGGERLEVGGEAREPDARLSGFSLAGLGDVNGDGLADVTALVGDGSSRGEGDLGPIHLFPGSAQRLAGEVSLQDLSVPLQVSGQLMPIGVGDLDGDGLGDLLIRKSQDYQMSFELVYGSADLLQGPLDATRVSATFTGSGPFVDLYDGGDYDGDGKDDLLLWKTFWNIDRFDDPSTQVQSDQARLIPGSSTRYAGAYDLDVIQASSEPRPKEWYAALPGPAGDFDADGRSDVVLVNSSDVRIKFGATLQTREIR